MKLYHFCILVTLLGACTPIYYVPNAPTVPLITEKGEGDLSVSVAREGAHFQTSYGFTNSITAFTNIQIGPPESGTETDKSLLISTKWDLLCFQEKGDLLSGNYMQWVG